MSVVAAVPVTITRTRARFTAGSLRRCAGGEPSARPAATAATASRAPTRYIYRNRNSTRKRALSLCRRPVERAPGTRGGHLAVLERHLAVDDHDGDALGVLVRLLEGRAIA